MTCSILCTFGLTEALWIVCIKAVHQKNSPYVSPELLYCTSASHLSQWNQSEKSWKFMECVLLLEELCRLCWSYCKCYKREHLTNLEYNRTSFSLKGIFTKRFYIRLVNTALFTARTLKIQSKTWLLWLHYLAFIKRNPKPWAQTITWGLSHKTRVNYLKNYTYILRNAPWFNTRCWYNCKKILS